MSANNSASRKCRARQPGGPIITLPSTVAPPGAEKVIVLVRDVQVVGSTIYRADELAALYADLLGHQVTLAAVYEIAARITDSVRQ